MSEESNIPQSISEAVNDILLMGRGEPDNFNARIDEGELGFTAGLHHTVGRWIRNNWGLWEKKGDLYKVFESLEVTHPDDMSNIILTLVYRVHTGAADTNLEGLVPDPYKDYIWS